MLPRALSLWPRVAPPWYAWSRYALDCVDACVRARLSGAWGREVPHTGLPPEASTEALIGQPEPTIIRATLCAAFSEEQPRSMMYVRLFADTAGESHFEDVGPELRPVSFAPPAPALELSVLAPAAQYAFPRVPSDWNDDWHCSPRRQLRILLSGE